MNDVNNKNNDESVNNLSSTKLNNNNSNSDLELKENKNSPKISFDDLVIKTLNSEKYSFSHLQGNSKDVRFKKDKSLLKLSNFQNVKLIGCGTYGEVYKVRRITEVNCNGFKELREKHNIQEEDEFYALKKLIIDEKERNGFPITALREISILQDMNHKNIVRLLDTVVSKGNISKNFYIVLEYIEYDLADILEKNHKFSDEAIKSIMYQILLGINYLHRTKNVIHRDIKASNILISKKGEVKIADFGLARYLNVKNKKPYTPRVVTLWYRAPELFMGECNYTESIDVWSLGILFWQLFLGKCPIRSDENNYFHKLIETLGSIEDRWPEVETKYENFKKLVPSEKHQSKFDQQTLK